MSKYSKFSTYAVLVLTIAALLVTIIGGCTAARKPAPENEPNPQAVPGPQAPTPTPVRNMPTNPSELNRISERLADEITDIRGINRSTVVISGNTAYVGVDMDANSENISTENIKREVVQVSKAREPRLGRILVSTDADTVTRLNKVADGLADGRPLSAFDQEMAEIARRMSPAVR